MNDWIAIYSVFFSIFDRSAGAASKRAKPTMGVRFNVDPDLNSTSKSMFEYQESEEEEVEEEEDDDDAEDDDDEGKF